MVILELKFIVEIIPWIHHSNSNIHKIAISYLSSLDSQHLIFVEGDNISFDNTSLHSDKVINYPIRDALLDVKSLSYKRNIVFLDMAEDTKYAAYLLSYFKNIHNLEYLTKLKDISYKRVEKWVTKIKKKCIKQKCNKCCALIGEGHCLDLYTLLISKKVNVYINYDLFGDDSSTVKDIIVKFNEFWNLKNEDVIMEKWSELNKLIGDLI